MALRLQCESNEDTLRLLSGPYLSLLRGMMSEDSTTRYPRLYFSYNPVTRQTTIVSTGLNDLHLSMIQHLKESFIMSMQTEEIVARILLRYFVVAQQYFAVLTEYYDRKANGQVSSGNALFPLALLELTMSL